MHDLDRTTLESDDGEMFELSGEMEGEDETEGEGPFNEAELMELAAELLTLSNESELNQFLGGIFKKLWSGAKALTNSSVGRAVVSGLKSVARQTLPAVGGALGNFVLPGAGGAIGSDLASGASHLFGLELEGLSHEDREFEVAKQFVNLAGAALQSAAQATPTASPNAAAKIALVEAAKAFAPGLVPMLVGEHAERAHDAARPTHGTWRRVGQTIVLDGL